MISMGVENLEVSVILKVCFGKINKKIVHSYFVESLEKDDYPVITNDGISFDFMEFKRNFLTSKPHIVLQNIQRPQDFLQDSGDSGSSSF